MNTDTDQPTPANQPQKSRPALLAEADLGDAIQMIGNDSSRMASADFEFRPMTIEDIEDDCPICMANREAILAGNPPWAYIQKPAA